MTATSYQLQIEMRALLKMAFIMIVSGLSFIFSASARVRDAAHRGDITAPPVVIGIILFACAAGYIALFAVPATRKIKTDFRRGIYWLLSLPLGAFTMTIGAVLLSRGSGIASLMFGVMYLLIFMSGYPVFNGYSKRFEIIELALLVSLMLIIAYLVSTSVLPVISVLEVPPALLSGLCIVGAIVYASFLHPKVQRLPWYTKHRLFTWSSFILPLYSILSVIYMVHRGEFSLFSPITLINVHLIIMVTGKALYRPEATDEYPGEPHGVNTAR